VDWQLRLLEADQPGYVSGNRAIGQVPRRWMSPEALQLKTWMTSGCCQHAASQAPFVLAGTGCLMLPAGA